MSIYQILEAIEEIAETGILSNKEINRLNKIKRRKIKIEKKNNGGCRDRK